MIAGPQGRDRVHLDSHSGISPRSGQTMPTARRTRAAHGNPAPDRWPPAPGSAPHRTLRAPAQRPPPPSPFVPDAGAQTTPLKPTTPSRSAAEDHPTAVWERRFSPGRSWDIFLAAPVTLTHVTRNIRSPFSFSFSFSIKIGRRSTTLARGRAARCESSGVCPGLPCPPALGPGAAWPCPTDAWSPLPLPAQEGARPASGLDLLSSGGVSLQIRNKSQSECGARAGGGFWFFPEL